MFACGGAGAVLGQVDLAAFVAGRIAQARGVMSPQTAAWLHSTDFRGLMWWAAALFGAAAFMAWRLRPTWHAWLRQPAASLETALGGASRARHMLIAFCAFAVALRYAATLRYGYFRYDDFDLLSVAHHHPWRRACWLPHGDHFLPLTRLLASAAYALFGVTAWPYNLGVLASLAAVVIMGARLLAEFKVSCAAQLLFVALVVPWSPWGEIMAGYYILSSYTLIAALGLAAIWCYLRWRASPHRRFLWGASLCTLAATLLDISGWYVPPALGVFLAADFLHGATPRAGQGWLATHREVFVGLGLACLPGLAGAIYAYGIVNHGLFLSMGGGGVRSLPRLAGDLFYLLDVGLLVSFVTPFIYARLPLALLGGLAAIALLVWLAFMVGAVRAASRPQRIILGAIAAVLAGTCLMVNLGRPSEATMVVRWAAKHVGPSFVWLGLLIAFAWHVRWTQADAGRKIVMAELTLVGLGVFWSAQAAFGQLGLAVAFPPFGYSAEIRDAIDRRAAITEITEKIVRPIALARSQSGTVAPTLDGPYLALRYPSLFEYNLSTYTPFFVSAAPGITFIRNPAMHLWRAPDVATVSSLRVAVSPEFLELLVRNPVMRDYYFAHIPLRSTTGRNEFAHQLPSGPQADGTALALASDGTAAIISDGKYELWLRRTAFDPESSTLLRLAIDRLGPESGQGINLAVVFTTDFAATQGGGSITLAPPFDRVTEVDLRQLYAFALSRRVSDLRLIFTEPGRYRLRVATLVR
jgi:hypothetical protein